MIVDALKGSMVVDALNQKLYAMHATTISMCKSNLKNRILKVLVKYEHYRQVKEGL
jgi:hypothetical protein